MRLFVQLGRALNMLSGGIDSPVAAYRMAKRGLALDHIHFASPPYTSERAKLKVKALAQKITPYTGSSNLFVVPYTRPQEYIRDHAPDVLFSNGWMQYGTNYIAVMPTNLYGPNDNFHLENSHVMPAMMRKIYLAKLIHDGDWDDIRADMDRRPVEGVSGQSGREEIAEVLGRYGIEDNRVTLWGTGTPLREFLWSEDMADASVHCLLNVDFKDIIGIEKYSSVHYGARADGAVDRNHSEGRGGALPALGEIRNCHINVGTGKELTIRQLSELVAETVGFQGEVVFDSSKPDGTMRKLISVEKLHRLGWKHSVEIEEGVRRLFQWYRESLNS